MMPYDECGVLRFLGVAFFGFAWVVSLLSF